MMETRLIGRMTETAPQSSIRKNAHPGRMTESLLPERMKITLQGKMRDTRLPDRMTGCPREDEGDHDPRKEQGCALSGKMTEVALKCKI